jgi:hypothetical protein
MKKICSLFIIGVLVYCSAKAQKSDTIASIITKDVNKLKTGQANDVLTNFYQLAIKNVFGSKKELSYSSTIFGLLDSVSKGKYEDAAFYKKTRWARNVELNVTSRIDTNNNVSAYGGGIKIYIVNARDVTKEDKHLNSTMSEYESRLMDTLQIALRKFFGSPRIAVIHSSISKYGEHFDYKKLDPELIDTLKKMHSGIVNGSGLAAVINQYFTDQINLIKKKPLWSIGGTYLHSIQNKNDTTTIKSDFLVGLGKNNPDNFWEFSVSTYLQLFNNRAPQSTASQKFHFETGFNKILSENSAGESNMELKFFGSYDKVFNTTTIPTTTTANLTYRYLVSRLGGFWIPVTLSYDPDKGKFLGFIDLTFNIDPKK